MKNSRLPDASPKRITEADLPREAKGRLAELDQNPAWLALQTGISRALVYAWLSGRKGLSWTNLEKVFAALGQDLSILLTPRKGPIKRPKPPTPPEMPV